MSTLAGQRALILVGDDYEDLEFWYPKLRIEEAGAKIIAAGLEAKREYRGKHGYPCKSDAAVSAVSAADFELLVIPGGWMPDKLRRDPNVLSLVRAFFEAGKLVATICHGPWILISAGVCRGVRITGTPAIRDDLMNAGAIWCDESVVVDRNVISSRRPQDLPAFGAAIVSWRAK